MSSKFKGFIALAAAAQLIAVPALQASGVGTTGAQFLKVGVGARALAMGGAFTALADGADALYWNPGALGMAGRRDLSMSYNALFQDQSQGFIGYVHPLGEGKGTVGTGIDYLMVSDIEKRAGDTENADSTFTNSNYAVLASYGRALGDDLSVGGNVKFIRTALDTFKENAAAVDLGALYKTPVENLSTGLVVQNLGTKIGPDPLPVIIKTGAAYRMLEQKLALAADGEFLVSDKRNYLDLGTEYWINKALALRAGYQLGRGRDQLGGGLVGAGFGLGIAVNNFRLDYAFLPFGDLGNTHRATFGWAF